MYYVYLLQSKRSKRHYIGYTNDLRRRLAEHQSPHRGYTGNEEWELVYYESFYSKEDAIQREKKLKQDGRSRRFLMQRTKKSQEELSNK